MDIYQKTLEKSLKLITKKRYTSAELKNKLRSFVGKVERLNESLSINSEEIDALIEHVLRRLEELKYVDDQKFADDYVQDRIRFKPRGLFMIEHELKKKGLTKEQIQKATSGIDESEMTLIMLKKKAAKWQNEPLAKRREKAFRFLASKGFSADTIYKAMESYYSNSS